MLAVAAAAPAAAPAGIVQIRSCGDAPAGSADTAWQLINDNLVGYEEPAAACPPTGFAVGTDLDHAQILGRSVWTKLSSGVAPAAGAGAEMRFAAPADSTIVAVSIKRDVGTRSDGYYVYGRTDVAQLGGESCTRLGGEYGCNVGGFNAGYSAFTGLSARWIAWGFQCGANAFPSCGTGSSLHAAWAHVYASTVTLVDNQNPTAVTAGGDVTSSGWKGGTVAGTISGADNLGVQKVRWYADGGLVSTSADRACDFSVTVPCSDATDVAFGLDTRGLSDGSHSVEAAVVDPAGNEAKGSAFPVRVDNTVPTAPTALVVTGGGTSAGIGMRWSNPAADGGAAYVSSRWEACSGATCSSGTGGLTSASGSLPNVSGTYTVKVWLVDAAGNGSSSTAATGSVTYVAPAAGGGGGGGGSTPTVPTGPTPTTPAPPVGPGPTPTPPLSPTPAPRDDASIRMAARRLDARTGRVSVRGFITRRASGTVTITVTTKRHRQTVKARIRRGRYAATIRLPKGTKRARVTVRYGGSATTKPGRMTRTITSR